MFAEAERVLQTDAETPSTQTASSQINVHYRLDSVVDFIRGLKATRIALQFPDHLLVDTPMVVAELQKLLDSSTTTDEAPATYSLFVLSDNTFGACCPDEITAAHYSAQCIIHFGYACMSRTNRLPVMYVAERGEYSVDGIKELLESSANAANDQGEEGNTQIIVVLSQPARYLRAEVGSIAQKLATNSSAAEFLVADRPVEGADEGTRWLIAGDSIPRLSATSAFRCQRFIFVGTTDSPVLVQLAMICRFNDSIGKDGSDLQIATPSTASETPAQRAMAANKALRTVDQRLQKRMYNIEMLKASGSIGILVCTLAIKNYRESAEILSRLIRKAGKRCYIIYIGHINEHKIANFVDSIDCFVVISCPHSRQAQFPQKDDNFMKPLCSPIEALISLGHAEFDDPQAYTTGFAECCERAAGAAGIGSSPRIANSAAAANASNDDGEVSTALVKARGAGAVTHFAQRTYKGLEARLGETEVQTELVQGNTGIAKGYSAEKEAQGLS